MMAAVGSASSVLEGAAGQVAPLLGVAFHRRRSQNLRALAATFVAAHRGFSRCVGRPAYRVKPGDTTDVSIFVWRQLDQAGLFACCGMVYRHSARKDDLAQVSGSRRQANDGGRVPECYGFPVRGASSAVPLSVVPHIISPCASACQPRRQAGAWLAGLGCFATSQLAALRFRRAGLVDRAQVFPIKDLFGRRFDIPTVGSMVANVCSMPGRRSAAQGFGSPRPRLGQPRCRMRDGGVGVMTKNRPRAD
jgi:hypothetical protein